MGKENIYWFECKITNRVELYTYPLAYSKHFSACIFREGDIIGISEYPVSGFSILYNDTHKTNKHIIHFDLIQRFDYDKKLILESISEFRRSVDWIEISDKINRDLKLKDIINEDTDI